MATDDDRIIIFHGYIILYCIEWIADILQKKFHSKYGLLVFQE